MRKEIIPLTRRAPISRSVSIRSISRAAAPRPSSAITPSYVPAYDPGAPYANADGQVAAPNVDLTEEAIQQLVARYTFAANARVVTAYDQMVKSLLDITA